MRPRLNLKPGDKTTKILFHSGASMWLSKTMWLGQSPDTWKSLGKEQLVRSDSCRRLVEKEELNFSELSIMYWRLNWAVSV